MNQRESPASPQPIGSKEKKALEKLVHGIVLAQGNIFIKELLRQRKITIGITKADFERNLIAAIEQGKLTRSIVDQWLDEVEGWGAQHVYVFKVPKIVADKPLWSSIPRVEAVARRAGLGKLWNAQSSLEFPKKRSLTGVYFDGNTLRLVWHQGLITWVRDASQDYEKEIGDERYQFRAYREQAERSVLRFELRLPTRLAVISTQIPWNAALHKEARDEVQKAVQPFLDIRALEEFPIARAIKMLDQAELQDPSDKEGRVKAQSTRLSGGGAYVEFATPSRKYGYKHFAPVRDVRRAVEVKAFKGSSGVFLFPLSSGKDLERSVKVQLYGKDRRIRLWAQMTAQEVWGILETIKKYS